MPASPGALGDRPFQVSLHEGGAGLEEIAADWAALEKDAEAFYQLHAWYSAYLQHLETEPQAVQFALVRRGHVPVAVLPLKYETRPAFGLPLRLLCPPLHSHFDLADTLFSKRVDSRHVLAHVVRALRRRAPRAWDALYVHHAPRDGAFVRALARSRDCRSTLVQACHSNRLDCTGTYEDVLARLSSSFRRNLRRVRRKAENVGALEFRDVGAGADVERAFEHFVEVEAAGWKGADGDGTAIALHPRLTRFYRHLLHTVRPVGIPHVRLLLLSGRAIAAQYCIQVGGTLFMLKIGYDEAFGKLSPGNLLLDDLIRRCSAAPSIHAISFVLDAAWTHAWAPHCEPVYNAFVFNRTARGMCAYSLSRLRALNPSRSAARRSGYAEAGQRPSPSVPERA